MKNIIITGADGNLGNAVVPVFLNAGYKITVTVFDKNKNNGLPAHNDLSVEQVNLSNEEESAAFVTRTIDHYNKVDAGILLVGGFTMGSIATTSLADIHKQYTLNFDTAYNIARPLFNHMMLNGTGRLVFIGARPALNAADGKSALAYALSKSLLFKLAEYLNEEAKGTDVSVTVIVPSTLDTPANRKSMPDVDPIKWVDTTDLANILEFVTSDKGKALRETVLKVYNRS